MIYVFKWRHTAKRILCVIQVERELQYVSVVISRIVCVRSNQILVVLIVCALLADYVTPIKKHSQFYLNCETFKIKCIRIDNANSFDFDTSCRATKIRCATRYDS